MLLHRPLPLALLLAFHAPEAPTLVELPAAPTPPESSAPPRPTPLWVLHQPGAPDLPLHPRSVGRGGYAIDHLPETSPYHELWVVSATPPDAPTHLAFVHVDPDGQRGIALYESTDARHFHLAAHIDDAPQAWDWAVPSPDGRHVAVWGRPLDVYRREGPDLVFERSLGAGYFKAFPQYGPSGRLAARLVGGEDGAQAVLVDGIVGPAFDHVDEPFFDATGEHLVYRARRDGEHFLVVDGALHGPYPDLELHPRPAPRVIARVAARVDGRWRHFELR